MNFFVGVSLVPVSLVPDFNRQTLGEYTDLHRVDFTATYQEVDDTMTTCGPDGMSACECGVRGDDLWQLRAFITRRMDAKNNLGEVNNTMDWRYPYVEDTIAMIHSGIGHYLSCYHATINLLV